MAVNYWHKLLVIYFVQKGPNYIELSIYDRFNFQVIKEVCHRLLFISFLYPASHLGCCQFFLVAINCVWLEVLIRVFSGNLPSSFLDRVVYHNVILILLGPDPFASDSEFASRLTRF